MIFLAWALMEPALPSYDFLTPYLRGSLLVFAVISESDWKKFKKLKVKALDKLCGQALRDCKAAINEQERSNHEKYLRLYELIQNHDERIARIFNGHARSKAGFELTLRRQV